MGYIRCLKLAGAEILNNRCFGSYQGDWLARVNYNGQTGWVHGSYGSCSGCDAFEAEFGYTRCKEHGDTGGFVYGRKEPPEGCDFCSSIVQKMREFGESYLENIESAEDILKKFEKQVSWDFESKDVIEYVRETENPVEQQ